MYVRYILSGMCEFRWLLAIGIGYSNIQYPTTNNQPISQSLWFIFNTLRPRQNGRHFSDDTFKPNFLNENIRISIKISLNFVPKVPINNIPALVQIMAWRQPGDKPLSEPMMVCLLTHICGTRPQWVKWFCQLPTSLICDLLRNC